MEGNRGRLSNEGVGEQKKVALSLALCSWQASPKRKGRSINTIAASATDDKVVCGRGLAAANKPPCYKHYETVKDRSRKSPETNWYL
ncbi:hypothetical protein CEXT_472131 [Caerostris extrusa]|uniref:Uncharacterized protein n=1 Tax=Caerostris extrusa TaxID=172846 RepID=A0AAV4MPT3_CAEEX|nr:hypothetical protein CEXT_472131 [Caerostris extrusa]